MLVKLKGKIIGVSDKVSTKTGQGYKLLLIQQDAEVCNLMLDRNCTTPLILNEDVIVTADYNTRFNNINSVTDIKKA